MPLIKITQGRNTPGSPFYGPEMDKMVENVTKLTETSVSQEKSLSALKPSKLTVTSSK